MTATPFRFSPEELTAVAIEVVPVDEEEDDLDTIAFAGHVRADIQRELAHFKGYTVISSPTNERGIDILVLITLLGASIPAYKDLLISLFTTISTTIEVLAKRGRVQEIQ